MSVLPPRTDIVYPAGQVRNVPRADISPVSVSCYTLQKHFVESFWIGYLGRMTKFGKFNELRARDSLSRRLPKLGVVTELRPEFRGGKILAQSRSVFLPDQLQSGNGDIAETIEHRLRHD